MRGQQLVWDQTQGLLEISVSSSISCERDLAPKLSRGGDHHGTLGFTRDPGIHIPTLLRVFLGD